MAGTRSLSVVLFYILHTESIGPETDVGATCKRTAVVPYLRCCSELKMCGNRPGWLILLAHLQCGAWL